MYRSKDFYLTSCNREVKLRRLHIYMYMYTYRGNPITYRNTKCINVSQRITIPTSQRAFTVMSQSLRALFLRRDRCTQTSSRARALSDAKTPHSPEPTRGVLLSRIKPYLIDCRKNSRARGSVLILL